MRYVEDMRKATLAEFDKEEAERREHAERQVLHLCGIVDPLPTPEELVPLHRGFDSLNVNLSWPELWDRLGPFWRGPFWL